MFRNYTHSSSMPSTKCMYNNQYEICCDMYTKCYYICIPFIAGFLFEFDSTLQTLRPSSAMTNQILIGTKYILSANVHDTEIMLAIT